MGGRAAGASPAGSGRPEAARISRAVSSATSPSPRLAEEEGRSTATTLDDAPQLILLLVYDVMQATKHQGARRGNRDSDPHHGFDGGQSHPLLAAGAAGYRG